MDSIGVVLTNTGSPAAPTPEALKPYLAEFLADRRIVNLPRWLWLPILHTIILNTRPSRSARLYQNIWTETGSPLLAIVARQVSGLQARLDEHLTEPVHVVSGMRYGQPSIAAGLEALRQAGVRRVLVLPLFPQYSGTTVGSAVDGVEMALAKMDWRPMLLVVDHYHDRPGYLGALVSCIEEHQDRHGAPDRTLFSFHGIPQSYARAGDPYEGACRDTARWVAERVGLRNGRWEISFQSRFGPVAWLQPYTDELLVDWAREGVGTVDVICPGFSADCLETLDEIGREAHHIFMSTGGGALRYIPALNDRPDHLDALAEIVLSNL
jgi:ferrochelatase